MRPFACVAFLGILSAGTHAHATAMFLGVPSSTSEPPLPLVASTPAGPVAIPTEPRDAAPNVGFEATGFAIDVWRGGERVDPLPAAREFGVPIEVGETGPTPPACSDSFDNDGDGFADFPDDPGCVTAGSVTEQPRCQDGIDTDEDGAIDFDGGASLNGGVPLASPDPECAGAPWRDRERP